MVSIYGKIDQILEVVTTIRIEQAAIKEHVSGLGDKVTTNATNIKSNSITIDRVKTRQSYFAGIGAALVGLFGLLGVIKKWA